ncbi:MAG: hypothetical protein NTV42_05765 [Chloroflexi bacterium]|nr:hypothetical protein [Chloroflexota bacterium]
MKNSESKFVLWKDKEWSQIDGEPCRVVYFGPLGSRVDIDGEIQAMDKFTPYASVTIECKKLGKNVRGYITHKIDFANLWAAFEDRKVKENEEVIIIWTQKHYKVGSWLGRKLYSAFMPKIWVMVCHRGAFELMTNGNTYNPDLTGEARWKAQQPIVQWKPDVME